MTRTWRDDRDEGFALARERRRRAALPLLTRALAGCRAEQETAAGTALVDVLITESTILTALLHSRATPGDPAGSAVDVELSLLVRAVELQERLATEDHLTGVVRHGGHATMLALSEHVERRRAELDVEIERIDLLEESADFFGRLVGLLVRLGLPEAALVASERARARALNDLLSARGASDPPVDQPLPVERTLTVAGIRDAVSRYGATVVEYWLDDAGAHAWVIRPDGRIAHTVLPADRGRIRALLAFPEELHAVLVAPLPLLPAPGEPLAVVAHRELHTVAFAALTGPDGQPLVATRPLVLLPSIGTLGAADLLADRRVAAPPRVLVLADPQMPDDLPRLDTLRADLPLLTEMFPAVDLITGPDATLRALSSRSPGHDLVLLGTHGHADDSDPAAGFLALAPDDDHSGHARIGELAGLRLDAGFVVLLACETAAGRITGDGVLAIGRAFLLAGARSLVSTLRPVVEKDASELVIWMLDAWVGGAGPADALRQAQLKMHEGRPDRPRRWNAFVLTGAWR